MVIVMQFFMYSSKASHSPLKSSILLCGAARQCTLGGALKGSIL